MFFEGIILAAVAAGVIPMFRIYFSIIIGVENLC